jgi:two-component system LytT family sensor kinase
MVMRTMQKNILNNAYVHILFWLTILSIQAIIDISSFGEINRSFYTRGILLPVQALICYLNIQFFIPRYLLQKKYVVYSMLVMIGLLLAGFCQRLATHYLILPVYENWCTPLVFDPKVQFLDALALYPIVTFTAALKLFGTWYTDHRQKEELEKEKLQSELKYLKTQIHPHFFFNTLNNLYALTLIKSDHAPEVVLKLSGLMDYLLYESNTPYVTLAKEIEHIKSYLTLEKLRFGKRLQLAFNLEGDLNNKNIAPMLILPFIENTFKHGIRNSIEQGWVKIDMKIVNDNFHMIIENSKPADNEPETEKGNIGLRNVKRRLELLYPFNYEMNITNTPETFKVELTLKLSYKTASYDKVLDY